jgi:hypothetical protein
MVKLQFDTTVESKVMFVSIKLYIMKNKAQNLLKLVQLLHSSH